MPGAEAEGAWARAFCKSASEGSSKDVEDVQVPVVGASGLAAPSLPTIRAEASVRTSCSLSGGSR